MSHAGPGIEGAYPTCFRGRSDQQPDRGRLRRAGRPLRARRRDHPSRRRVPHRGQGRARGLGLRGGPDARGQGHRAAGDRQDARGEDRRAHGGRRHPLLGEAAGEVPGRADRDDAPAGPRAQAGAQALRGARHRLDRRRWRRPRARRNCARSRASGRRRRRTSSKRIEDLDGEAPQPRMLLSQALRVAEPILDALRAHPGADRVELAGSRAAAGGHRQGPRHHRHGA